jgi:DNA-directed RNA polymerase specialized sigma24 family protein
MFKDKNIISTILLNFWVTTNFNELKNICNKITRGQDYDDLLQICIEQFLKNKKVADIPDKEKLFFFARIVRNNYNSNSSPYYHTYKKFKFTDIDNLDIEYLSYEESPINLDWVKTQLNDLEWYFKRLMEMYIEEGCSITKLSKRTTIPLNSVSRDINKVRRILNQKRKEELNK